MAQFNYAKLALRVDKIIKRFGRAPSTTFLRRRSGSEVTDYEIAALEADYNANNRGGSTIRRDNVEYIISIVDLAITPNEETDVLLLINDGSEQELEILAPPKRTAPGGVNLFWQINCKER